MIIDVNKEELLYALLEYGFDKVDNILLNITYKEFIKRYRNNEELVFVEGIYSNRYNTILDFDINGMYSYKKDKTIIKPHSLLLNYVAGLDFKHILGEKMTILGIESPITSKYLYSDKELSMINSFRIKRAPKEISYRIS